LRQFVRDRLEKPWSPEEISQALRSEFPADRARHVVHETIYQAVYRPELGGLPGELPVRVLRTRRRRRRPHRRPGERRPSGIIAIGHDTHEPRPSRTWPARAHDGGRPPGVQGPAARVPPPFCWRCCLAGECCRCERGPLRWR
jgi:hypothetical protein